MVGGERQQWSLGALAVSIPPVVRKPWGARVLAVLHPVFAVLGVALLAMLVQHAGAEELGRVMSRAAPWLPLVLLLEVARLSLDAVATWVAYGSRAREVPWHCMLRAQLISTAVSSVAPNATVCADAPLNAFTAPALSVPAATVVAPL